MKKGLIILIFVAIILTFLLYMYLPLLKRPNKIQGIYDIEQMLNKKDSCRYYSIDKRISFSGLPTEVFGIDNTSFFPSKNSVTSFCNFNYRHKFPFSGTLRIDHCQDSLFHGTYNVKWSSYSVDPLRMDLVLESDIWVINLREIEGFSMNNMTIESGIDHNKIEEFKKENKPYVWRECK